MRGCIRRRCEPGTHEEVSSSSVSSSILGVDLSFIFTQMYVRPSSIQCLWVFTDCSTVLIASRTCLMSADALLVLVTWYALYVRGTRKVSLKGGSFVHVLLRDGMVICAHIDLYCCAYFRSLLRQAQFTSRDLSLLRSICSSP